jgi:hypothetical protein
MVRRNREAAGRRGRGKKGVRSVDLSDVETFVAFPEGKFHLRVKAIEEGEGDAGDYWKWIFEDASKRPVDGTVTHITSFAKQALFNLKSLLESLAVDIPDSEFDLDISDMVGLELMAETAQEDVETDNGRRTYTRIVDHWPLDQENDKPGKGKSKKEDDEEDEKPARGSKKKKKSLSADDVKEMSQDELEELIEEHKLDIDLGDFKTVSKMRAAVTDALVEAEVIEGEEEPEEEEEKPARRSRRAKKEEEEEPEEEDDRPSRRRSRR